MSFFYKCHFFSSNKSACSSLTMKYICWSSNCIKNIPLETNDDFIVNNPWLGCLQAICVMAINLPYYGSKQFHRKCIFAIKSNWISFRYRAEEQLGLDGGPLQWWRSHEASYPLLSQLARQYLCVPATCTSPKQLFASAKDSLSSKLSSVEPHLLNIMIFLNRNSWIKFMESW